MRAVVGGLRWVLGKGAAFLVLSLAALLILLLPAAAVPVTQKAGLGQVIVGARMDAARYREVVTLHLQHLAQGRLVPAPADEPAPTAGPVPEALPDLLRSALPVTMRLLAAALGATLALGLLAGILLSRYTPGWARAPAWGGTFLLLALPDLLMVTALQLGVLHGGRALGLNWPVVGEPTPEWLTWRHYLVPWLALTLLPLPYIARVTAAALDEAGAQLYARAAVARGLSPARVLLKHVGRNALVRVGATLPVVIGVLISAVAVVEYMTDFPGLGRELIRSQLPRTRAAYAAVVYLLPLLALFVLADAAGDGITRLLDPRQRGGGEPRRGLNGAPARGAGVRAALADLVGTIVSWAASAAAAVAEWAAGGRRRVAGRERAARGTGAGAGRNPVLWIGVLAVAALVAVAVLAPQVAPRDPAEENMAYIDKQGIIQKAPFPPGREFILGTDQLGRDMLSRLVYGTQFALALAGLAVPVRFLLAALFGLPAAWYGGAWEAAVRRLATFFTAIPALLIPLAFIQVVNDVYRRDPAGAVIWGVLILALPGFPRLAESIRQQAREVMTQPFITAAESVGAGPVRVLLRHLFPHLMPQLVTMMALEVPLLLTQTAILGMLRAYPGGVIVDEESNQIIAPLMPEWGSMMEHPFRLIKGSPWWYWMPLAALSVAVLAFNLLGEGLRRRWASRTGWQ